MNDIYTRKHTAKRYETQKRKTKDGVEGRCPRNRPRTIPLKGLDFPFRGARRKAFVLLQYICTGINETCTTKPLKTSDLAATCIIVSTPPLCPPLPPADHLDEAAQPALAWVKTNLEGPK
jgi:hypothetical protein